MSAGRLLTRSCLLLCALLCWAHIIQAFYRIQMHRSFLPGAVNHYTRERSYCPMMGDLSLRAAAAEGEVRTGRMSKRKTILLKMLEEVRTLGREGEDQKVPLAQDPLLPLVEAIAQAADKRKAAAVVAKRVFHLTEVMSFVMVVEGYNVRQNQAISLAIKDDVEEQLGKTPVSVEGTAASGWIIMDYGSIMVHIMTPQMRNFYKLEKKWQEGEDVDLSHVLTADAPDNPNIVTFGPADAAEFNDDFDEDAAFWGDDLEAESFDLTAEDGDDGDAGDIDELFLDDFDE